MMGYVPWRPGQGAKGAVLLALLAFAVVASPRPEPPLEVLVENAADPFSRADGTGYANDVVRAAFAAVDVPIALVVVPYVRCKASVLDGSAPLCFSMSWLPEFSGRVRFADTPLFSVSPVYIENPSHPLATRSEAGLGRGIRIGTIRGYEYPESVFRAHDRGAILIDGSSTAANLKKLAAGRLEAVIVMESALAGTEVWIKQAGVQSLVREAFRSPSREVAYLGASVLHPRGLRSLERFNKGMALIQANGVLDSIRKRW